MSDTVTLTIGHHLGKDEAVRRLKVSLPWLLAGAAKRLLPILRNETTLLLRTN